MSIQFNTEKLIVLGEYREKIKFTFPYFWNFQSKPIIKSSNSKNKERTDLSIARARKSLYRIIMTNLNSKQKNKNLFVTFTFKKNETDIKKANYEFKKFIQRFYFFMGAKYKYITVIEFQKRGAVHYHTLFFDVPYIKNLHVRITELWGHGYTDIKPLYDIKNISAYLSKYIRKGFFDKRLGNHKAYFCSRSCSYPQVWRRQKDIDKFEGENIMKVSSSSFPSNKYGQINITTYKLIN